VGDLERQLASEREQSLSATKKAATVKAENEVLKKRLAELDGIDIYPTHACGIT